MARRLIAYDPHLKRPGCVILAAAMGTDLQLPQLFPVESWLLAPTAGMLRLPIDTEEQLAALIAITEEALWAYTDRSLCNCGYRDPSAVSPQFHGDRCLLRKADQVAWQKWYDATTAWEQKAQSDIKAMRLTAEALDFIEDRDAVRYGDMSVRTEYCLALLRKQLADSR